MRTTAGVVIFVAIFYVLIYGRIFQFASEMNFEKFKLEKFKIVLLFILIAIPVIAGFSIWSGYYFLNKSSVNKYINRDEYGLKIPEDYFHASAFIKNIELDTKIDIYPYTLGYQFNTWGYYGFILSPWMIDKPAVSFDKRTKEGKIFSKTNSMYMYHDKTLGDNYDPKLFFHKPETLIFSSPKIDIYTKKLADFLPHFYQKKGGSSNESTIEFKKINSSKYRIIVHRSHDPFLLTFTENFHPLWKMYLNRYHPNKNYQNLNDQLETYYKKPLVDEAYRATKKDASEYITNGWLTTLGDLKIKKKTYYEYVNERIVPENSENFVIDFISKNIKGTIQNDNLSSGNLLETYPLPEIHQQHHMVDGFANGWILNPTNLCSQTITPNCIKNKDGSYDFELIVEFWPQRLAYISYIISATTITLLLLFHTIGVFFAILRRKNNAVSKPRN